MCIASTPKTDAVTSFLVKMDKRLHLIGVSQKVLEELGFNIFWIQKDSLFGAEDVPTTAVSTIEVDTKILINRNSVSKEFF